MRIAPLLILAGLGVIAPHARAQLASPVSEPSTETARSAGAAPAKAKGPEIDAYCRYVRAVGESSSALLLSPKLFATFGNVPTSTLEDGEDIASSRARLQVGLSISPTRMHRGYITNDVARAECERYAHATRLAPPVPFSVDERRPLLSKIKVLEEAVARGQELRKQLAEQLDTALATVDDYQSLALQLNGLQQALAEASARLALLPTADPPQTSAADVASHLASEDALEEARARLRRSQAWELEVRVGYQRTFGVEQKPPVFALGILELSPGWLWQGSADASARAAHQAWLRARMPPAKLGPTDEQRAQLQRGLELTQQRARALSATLADLEERRVAIERVPGTQARHHAQFMWLQLAGLRAEQAYLNAYATSLKEALDDPRR